MFEIVMLFLNYSNFSTILERANGKLATPSKVDENRQK